MKRASSLRRRIKKMGGPMNGRLAAEGRWRTSDLPPELRAELSDRIAEADHGEGLTDAARAMDDAELMAEDVVRVLARGGSRQPAA